MMSKRGCGDRSDRRLRHVLRVAVHLRLLGKERGEVLRVGRESEVLVMKRGSVHHFGLHLLEARPELGVDPVALEPDRGQHLLAHQVRMSDREPQRYGSPVAVAEDVGLLDVQILQEGGRVIRQ